MEVRDPFFPALWRAVRRHWRRAFFRDAPALSLTDAERAQLLAAGAVEGPLQRYAIWRRSALFVVFGPTLLAALMATADMASGGKEGLSRTGVILTLAGALALWAMPISALVALGSWSSLERSQRAVIAGWAFSFLPPFLIALVPLRWWFDRSGPADQELRHRLGLAVLDVLDGLHLAFTLLPTALSILPGLVRACLRVKVLLPGTILPGWFLMTGPPFYLLLWALALIVLNHVAGSPLLVLGVLFSIGAPLTYVWRADLFVRPLLPDEVGTINRARRTATVATVAGGALLLTYLFTRRALGLHLVGLDAETSLIWLWENRAELGLRPGEAYTRAQSWYWIGNVSLSGLLIQYLGRSLFMTMVFADVLVRMSLSLWKQEKRFEGAPEAAEHDATMANLSRVLGSK
jgi:hypothetical protein